MGNAVKVAIVGLGRVGSTFIERLVEFDGKGVSIIAVAEKKQDAPGVEMAKAKGLKVFDSEEAILEMGGAVDVIFDLTGDKTVERNLRFKQVRSGNMHTVIVPRTVAVLIWNLISEETLPEHSSNA